MAGQKLLSAIILLALLVLGFTSSNTANARAVAEDKRRVFGKLPKGPVPPSGPSHGSTPDLPSPLPVHPSFVAHRVH